MAGWMTEGRRGGLKLRLLVRTRRGRLEIVDCTGIRHEVLHAFERPECRLSTVPGKSGFVFGVAQRDGYVAELVDRADFSSWPVRCRRKADALAMKRWCEKHPGA